MSRHGAVLAVAALGVIALLASSLLHGPLSRTPLDARSRYPDRLQWGFALEYSTLYLTDRFTGGPPTAEPLNQWVPLIEFAFDTLVSCGFGQKTIGTIAPGL